MRLFLTFMRHSWKQLTVALESSCLQVLLHHSTVGRTKLPTQITESPETWPVLAATDHKVTAESGTNLQVTTLPVFIAIITQCSFFFFCKFQNPANTFKAGDPTFNFTFHIPRPSTKVLLQAILQTYWITSLEQPTRSGPQIYGLSERLTIPRLK